MPKSEWIYPKERMTRPLWRYLCRKNTENIGTFGHSPMLVECQVQWGVTVVPTGSLLVAMVRRQRRKERLLVLSSDKLTAVIKTKWIKKTPRCGKKHRDKEIRKECFANMSCIPCLGEWRRRCCIPQWYVGPSGRRMAQGSAVELAMPHMRAFLMSSASGLPSWPARWCPVECCTAVGYQRSFVTQEPGLSSWLSGTTNTCCVTAREPLARFVFPLWDVDPR